MEKERICIIIPAYNEERRIGKTLGEYGDFFKNKKEITTEVLVVINNTKDRTEDVVKKFRNKYRNISYLNFKQGGKGFAINCGFKYAIIKKFDFIGFIDADCSTPPEAFYDLFLKIGDNAAAIANRWDKKSIIPIKQSFFRRIMSRVFNFSVRSLFFIKSKDTQCGAKLFKRKALEEILKELGASEWAFDVNLLYALHHRGFRIIDVPTTWNDTDGSKIKATKASWQMFLSILRLRVIYSPFEKLSNPIKPIVKALYNLTK